MALDNGQPDGVLCWKNACSTSKNTRQLSQCGSAGEHSLYHLPEEASE